MTDSVTNGDGERPGWLAKVLVVVAFVPFFGTPIGIGIIGYALGRRSAAWTRLAVVAGCGSFMIPIAAAMFMMSSVDPSRFLAEGRMEFSEAQLRSLVRSVEYYRVVYDRYPESLRDLEEQIGGAPGLFPATIESVHYDLSSDGSRYALRFLGQDDQAMTADDVLPALSSDEMGRVGYRPNVE